MSIAASVALPATLTCYPRYPLLTGPTPLQRLDRLSDLLGGPRIHIKRDDCTGLALGGNKARKLEFLVADALAQGADTLVTVGALQSNHARMTAAAAARAGLRCTLVLQDRLPDAPASHREGGNIFLDGLLGADVVVVPAQESLDEVLAVQVQALREQGRVPYAIAAGGSSPLGALGYVLAAHELLEQAADAGHRVDAIVLATGSAGTQAGLIAGLVQAGHAAAVHGHCVSRPAAQQTDKVQELASSTLAALGLPAQLADHVVHTDDRQIGSGYGHPTAAMCEAVQLLARFEAILLDPVYTGKAMAGLIADIRAGRYTREQQVVFIHTGGSPALFAYRWAFAGSAEEETP